VRPCQSSLDVNRRRKDSNLIPKDLEEGAQIALNGINSLNTGSPPWTRFELLRPKLT
jgi:hypothetical protein